MLLQENPEAVPVALTQNLVGHPGDAYDVAASRHLERQMLDAQDRSPEAEAYYRHTRREIQPLLPSKARRILEVGSGGGYTLRWLKSVYDGDVTTVGIEINSDVEDELARNADVAIIGNIDEGVAELGSFDLILFLDVLEHLPDPTRTLRTVTRNLARDGRVIVSVPNVAHLSVTLPLLLSRQFNYQDAGIMDRTHLRFFVESTAVKLLNDADLVVLDGLVSGLDGPRSRVLDTLSLGLLRHHLTKQYIMVGARSDGLLSQRKVDWKKIG